MFGENAVDTQTAAANLALALRKTGDPAKGCAILERVQKDIASERPEDTWTLEFARIGYERCQLEARPRVNVDATLSAMADSWNSNANHGDLTSRDALNALGSYAFALLEVGRTREAVQALERYVSLAELARRKAAEGSIARLAAFSSWVFEAAPDVSPISCYRELALLHAEDVELERALRVSEWARDRTLGDQFAEQEWLHGVLPEAARRQLEPLRERIQDLDERLAVVPDLVERVRLESERTVAVAQRGRLERDLRERLRLSEPESIPPTLDGLREHLDPGTALVSVMHSGDAWWALVIRRDEAARFVPLRDIDLGRNAAAWVRRLRGEPVRAWPMPDGRLVLDDLRPAGAEGGFLSTEQLARRLGRALLEPLAAAAGKARHLVFVGDDELVGIPLQALPLGEGLAVDRFDISYAPSLTTYARWQGRPAAMRPRDLLAIGAIEYPRRTGPSADDAVAIGLEYAADHPLPQARAEIASIGALFPASRKRLMLGAAARKADLRAASRSGELAGYRYVHLATHAWADPDRPEGSAVVLASDGSELPLQVVLTAAELAGLRMNADLIVLSACDTGAGHFEHGRGLLGLAYAALAAGNRAAVLSLWPIADDTTAPFMARFYARLARGSEPVAALAATQREFRNSRNPRLSDPAAWAPFLLYGGY
jgi:CHAT domain-containing protein